MKKYFKKILGFLGLLVIIYLIQRVGLQKIVTAFSGLKIDFLVLGLPFLFTCFIIWSYRLKYLLDRKKFGLSFWYLFKIYFIGNFYSTITPSQIGGVVMKTFYIKEKANRTFAETASVVILDKILEIIALLILGILGTLVLSQYLSEQFFIAAIVMFVLSAGILFLLMKKELGEIFFHLAYRFIIPPSIKEKAKLSFDAFYHNLPHWSALILPLTLATGGWIILYSFSYFLGLALGIKISFFIFVIIMAIASLFGLLPISFGGLGVREGAAVFLLELFAVSSSQAFTLSVLSYIIAKFLPALVGAALTLITNDQQSKNKKDINYFA